MIRKFPYQLVELTHLLSPEIPTWNGSCGFCLEIKKDYDRVFRVQQVKMHAGMGTHMDAPSHRIQGGRSIGDLSLDQFIVPAVLLDVSAKADADYELSVEDVEQYEKEYGRIEQGSLVMVYTGWERFWSRPDAYRNVDAEGQMHFPSVSKEAAELLLEGDVAGLAIDTLSPDSPGSDFPVHRLFLGAEKYIIENLANASQMPPKGGIVIALPLRMAEATEAPIRAVGLIPKALSGNKF